MAWLSDILGWSYFLAWSSSFYPQIYLNWKRRSVKGLSLDYEVYDFVGFVAYSIYNWGLLYSPAIRAAYAAAHEGGAEKAAVQLNDLFFAVHGVLATGFTLWQCAAYAPAPQPRQQSKKAPPDGDGGGGHIGSGCSSLAAQLLSAAPAGLRWCWGELSGSCRITCLACSALPVAFSCAIASGVCPNASGPDLCGWLSLLYFLSCVKVCVSVVKYHFQVQLNRRRASTAGFHVGGITLDLAGGVLSLLQIAVDAAALRDWGALIGDLAKVALGLLTLWFDAVLMLQHYVWYRRPVHPPLSGG